MVEPYPAYNVNYFAAAVGFLAASSCIPDRAQRARPGRTEDEGTGMAPLESSAVISAFQ
jgi:hypothetical protein